MYHKEYNSFVRASSSETVNIPHNTTVKGDEVKKLYLEVIGDLQSTENVKKTDQNNKPLLTPPPSKKSNEKEFSNYQLFYIVQNNDIDQLQNILDRSPEKINTVDDFGWSLLMIACQANCIQTVKELLKRGIDTSIRDKAGNSAQSLVIKNRNVMLADIFLEHSKSLRQDNKTHKIINHNNKCVKQKYLCEICDNKLYEDKKKHLASTVHNINASKNRKIPVNYVIPESNKGFQLLLRFGWNKDDGLGPSGSGCKYPIKTVKKNDRIGLGSKKNKVISIKGEKLKHFNKQMLKRDRDYNRQMEINFRRQFY